VNNPPAEALFPTEDPQGDSVKEDDDRPVNLKQISNRFFGAPSVFINVVQLSGNSAQLNEAMSGRIDYGRRFLKAGTRQELSCIGVCYEAFSGRVIKVLPGSDLYGNVFPGDQLVAEDGISPLESWQRGHNFGPEGSVTNITVAGQNGVKTIACHRKPISELMPGFENELNWSSLAR
jgi:hypothetical protein